MTKLPLASLNELEMDLLTELFNIGVGRAAGTLSEIVHQEIGVTIPLIELKPCAEVLHEIGEQREIISVSQEISGPFEMNSMLMFHAKNSLQVVKLMLGAHLSDEVATELQQEAFAEIGNIFLNACIGVIANTLETSFDVSLPLYERCLAEQVLTDDKHRQPELVLTIHLKLTLRESQIEGYLMFVLNEAGFGHLQSCLENVLHNLKNSEG